MSEPLVNELYDQIEKLEHANRRWKWATLGSFGGLALLFFLGGATAVLLIIGTRSAYQQAIARCEEAAVRAERAAERAVELAPEKPSLSPPPFDPPQWLEWSLERHPAEEEKMQELKDDE